MRRTDWWILGAAVALGILARFATLDLQSFHHDEAVQAGSVIQPGLGDTLAEVADGERSPPLYYVLHWAWAQMFGTGEVGLRSLSALIGTLMVPAACWAGRELVSTRVGLVAAAFVALNPLLVYYSQEARSYILMALFVTLSLALFARLDQRQDTRSLILWAAACSLALCSHYFAGFLILPQVAWLVYRGPRLPRLIAACGAIAMTALALLPFAASQQGDDRRDGFTDLSLPGRVAEVGLDYSASEDPDPLAGSTRVDAVQIGAGVGGGLLIVAAVGLAVRRGEPRERRAALLMAGVAALGVGVPALAAAVGLDFLKPRNAMAGAVPVLLAAAAGCGARGWPRAGVAAAAGLCAIYGGVVIAVNSTAEMQREDWRGLAEEIGPADGPRLLAAPQNGDDPLLYYMGVERFVGEHGRQGVEVDEVVAVSTTGTIDPPPGFRRAALVRYPPLFDVFTLRAKRPVNLTAAETEGILHERSAALYDPG